MPDGAVGERADAAQPVAPSVPEPPAADAPVRAIKHRMRRRKLSPVQVLARAAPDPLVLLERAAEQPLARAKSEKEFWQVWLAHLAYLRSQALRFSGGNVADAEDALSEAMLKAAHTFSSEAIHNPRAWFLRLVYNACMDRYRNNRRQTRLAKDITESDATSAPAVAIQPERSPEELCAAFQEIGRLRRALDSLPAFLSEPLLSYLDEESDADIAGRLNVTKEVIRKRRQIARNLLRRHMS